MRGGEAVRVSSLGNEREPRVVSGLVPTCQPVIASLPYTTIHTTIEKRRKNGQRRYGASTHAQPNKQPCYDRERLEVRKLDLSVCPPFFCWFVMCNQVIYTHTTKRVTMRIIVLSSMMRRTFVIDNKPPK